MIAALIVAASMTTGMELTKVSRDVKQDGGTWVLTYRLKAIAEPNSFLRRTETTIRLSGSASNSAVPGDGVGRRFCFEGSDASKEPGCFGKCTIHDPPNSSTPCKLTVQANFRGTSYAVVDESGCFDFQIRLGHDHSTYGIWEPLLGKWRLDVEIDGFRFADDLNLENPTRAYPNLAIQIPESWLEGSYYVSPPNSLYVANQGVGGNYRRLENIPVRYGTKLKFSCRYLVAVGTEGEPTIRFTQEIESSQGWRMVHENSLQAIFTRFGSWQEYSTVIQVGKEASLLDVCFCICGGEVGEMWVDDIKLEEVGFPSQRNP